MLSVFAMRNVLIAISLLVSAAVSAADNALVDAAKTLPANLENNRPLLFVPQLDAPKSLSGDLKDPVWSKAASYKMVSLEGGKIVPARLETTAHVFCSADALYVGVHCDDPDPKDATVSNANPWENDSIECFLYPGESCAGGKLYYQIAIDADKKAQYIHAHMYPRHNWRRLEDAWQPDIECETAKNEKSWGIEFKIKFSDLALTDEAKAKKTLWRMHLVRNRPARGDIPAQTYAWMPTDDTKQNHLPWRWGYIIPEAFATPELIADVAARAKGIDGPVASSEEITRRCKELIARFGNDEFSIRNSATQDLLALLSANKTLAKTVQGLLKKTIDATHDSEIKQRSIRAFTACGQVLDPDEDPLPPQLNY